MKEDEERGVQMRKPNRYEESIRHVRFSFSGGRPTHAPFVDDAEAVIPQGAANVRQNAQLRAPNHIPNRMATAGGPLILRFVRTQLHFALRVTMRQDVPLAPNSKTA